MILFSIIGLLLGLQHYRMSLASGVQTSRLGGAGPASFLHKSVVLTGCFFSLFGVRPN